MRIIALAMLLALPLSAQDMADVAITPHPVTDGITMLAGRGGNIAVLTGPDGVLMIDSQFQPLSGKIRAAIATLTDAPVRFLINTHWHGDHRGGNPDFRALGAHILAHRNVRTRMMEGNYSAFRDHSTPPAPDSALPVLTFGDGIELYWNGQTVRVIHLPGAHTDGDAVVFFQPANVLHTGDVVFLSGYPYIDVSSGGSPHGVLAATDRILELIDAGTRVIVGHGPVADRTAIRQYREMLATVLARIEAGIADGKMPEALIAEGITGEFDPRWGGGWIDGPTFVRMVHAALTAPEKK